MQLSELIGQLDIFWPQEHADDWDRVGLTVGNPTIEVSKVLVAVDLTHSVIDEAVANNCELVVTHHPALLRGINSLAEDELKGSQITRLIQAGIATFAAHTNADVQSDGATSVLAKRLGLRDLTPISNSAGGFGHGVIGTLPQEVSLKAFSKQVADLLPKVARGVSFAGSSEKPVRIVALCSGAGDSFLPLVLESSADVYVTSDLRHHPALDALETPRQNGQLALVDVSHWASESLWVTGAVERISTIPGLVAFPSKVQTDPWTDEVH